MKRALATLVVPGLLTFVAWQTTLGRIEPDHYSTAEGAALVLALLAVGIATGWLVRREKRRIYRQLLGELRGYSRRNLLDMGIDPEGLGTFARKAAGL